MFNFLKKLLSIKDGSHTVVLLNDDGSKSSTSHRVSPVNLWLILFGIITGVICLVIFLIMFTPFGKLVYNEPDVRKSVITIQQKVAALQDTLEARNMQLQQIQEVMAAGKDTSFSVPSSSQYTTTSREEAAPQNQHVNRIPPDAVLISNLFQRSPEFPAPYPVDGTPTRMFNNSLGHYGIDIAAKAGSEFRAVADGVVLNQEWTINYGYVIAIQHSQGIISIYKHASGVYKEIGDSVQKGEILGTIGDIGILSSGPHLHIEIWKRGIPQNPQNYLINS